MAPISDVNAYIDDLIKENKVMIFSKTYCPYCDRAKDIFKKLKEAFKVVELDKEENGAEIQASLHKKTGQRTVPNIFVNTQHVGGCSETQQAHKDGSLKKMLQN